MSKVMFHSYAIPPSVGMTKQGRNDKLDGNSLSITHNLSRTDYPTQFCNFEERDPRAKLEQAKQIALADQFTGLTLMEFLLSSE